MDLDDPAQLRHELSRLYRALEESESKTKQIQKTNEKLNKIQLECSNLTYKFYQKLEFKIKYIKKEYWLNKDDLYFMSMDL